MQPQAIKPGPERDDLVVLTPRRMAAVAFLAVLTSGLLCGVSYVAGRKSAAGADISRDAPLNAAPVRIVIPQPVPAPPRPIEIVEPADGLYLQLASVAPGVAAIIAQGLIASGVGARVAPGASDSVARVLVGPLEPDALAAERVRLENLGFQPFVRRVSNTPPGIAASAAPD
jgi:hypothetical protein